MTKAHTHSYSRAGDTILPWLRQNLVWLGPGAAVVGVVAGLWYKTEFATSVINPQTMLEFREKAVKRDCRASVTECFSKPGQDLAGFGDVLMARLVNRSLL